MDCDGTTPDHLQFEIVCLTIMDDGHWINRSVSFMNTWATEKCLLMASRRNLPLLSSVWYCTANTSNPVLHGQECRLLGRLGGQHVC
jgi:hypothetical protein